MTVFFFLFCVFLFLFLVFFTVQVHLPEQYTDYGTFLVEAYNLDDIAIPVAAQSGPRGYHQFVFPANLNLVQKEYLRVLFKPTYVNREKKCKFQHWLCS